MQRKHVCLGTAKFTDINDNGSEVFIDNVATCWRLVIVLGEKLCRSPMKSLIKVAS